MILAESLKPTHNPGKLNKLGALAASVPEKLGNGSLLVVPVIAGIFKSTVKNELYKSTILSPCGDKGIVVHEPKGNGAGAASHCWVLIL